MIKLPFELKLIKFLFFSVVKVIVFQYSYLYSTNNSMKIKMSVVPMNAFNAVSKKSNQILMAHMTNCFNFYSEFLLSLAPAMVQEFKPLTRVKGIDNNRYEVKLRN